MLARSVMQEWNTVSAALRGLRAMELTALAMTIAEKASFERGPTIAAMGDADTPTPAVQERLAKARAVSDAAFDATLKALANSSRDEHRAAIAQIEKAQAELAQAREKVSRIIALPHAERTAPSSRITREPIDQMFGVIDIALEAVTILSADAERVYPDLTQPLVGARLAAELREYAGRLGSQFTTPIGARQPLGAEERRDIPRIIGRIEELRHLIEVQARVRAADARVAAAISDMKTRYFGTGLPFINSLTAAGEAGGDYGMNLPEFVARYVPEMASIVKLRDTMFDTARTGAAASIAKARRNLHINAAVGVLVLLIEISVFLLIRWRVLKPLLTSTSAVVAIAAGKLDTPLRVTTRTDEIGDMQRAISDLRHTSADKRRLEREREQLIEKLQLHSNTDFLTNLLNRRAFTERVTQQLAIAQRNNWPVALIMFDLDHFKQVNDLHGHAVGDTVLTEVAVIASKLFRAADTLARHGGEEFIALLVNCGEADAEAFSNRVRAAIEAASFTGADGAAFRVTASFGVAAATAADVTDINAFTRLADQALYRAKAEGRNRVFRASMLGNGQDLPTNPATA
jgi:diguanylate cyclase (GGDEF)-like protein